MRKKILSVVFLSALVFCASVTSAQEFKTGDNVLSLGIGLGSAIGNSGYSSQTPAISLQYEHGQWDVGGPGVISLGGYLGFKGFKYEYPPFYSEKWNYTVIGIRSAYHLTMVDVDHLDLYGGLMLSYNILSTSRTVNDPLYKNYGEVSSSGLWLSLYLGGRYYFSDNVGAFMELGYGISYLSIGGQYKF